MYYIIYKYYTASIYVIHTAYINKAYTINTTDVCAKAAALDASAAFFMCDICWASVLPFLEPFGGILEDQRIRALIGEYSDAIIKANMRETIPSDLTYDVSG